MVKIEKFIKWFYVLLLMKNKMNQNKDLEGRIIRDDIAEVGLIAGTAVGFVYGLAAQDTEGVSLIQTIGKEAINGAGLAYIAGTVVKAIYKVKGILD